MKSFAQVLSTPTSDTPGTTLLLHFPTKRYIVGSLGEGTQRLCVQEGVKLLKCANLFISGRTEWRNTGGLLGMILTLADASASSAASAAEDAKARTVARLERQGVSGESEEGAARIEEELAKVGKEGSGLMVYGPKGLGYTLATARRFVFRKGMPVDFYEHDDDAAVKAGELGGEKTEDGVREWAPTWQDENIKVWAMGVMPSPSVSVTSPRSKTASSPNGPGTETKAGAVSPRKRSFDELNGLGPSTPSSDPAASTPNRQDGPRNTTPEQKQKNDMIVKSVVSEMFDSTWRLDALVETPLSQVQMPASLFVRNPDTHKLEKYAGPPPGSAEHNDGPSSPGSPKRPQHDPIVLVRRPWPGALIESLPPTSPAEYREAISYIVKNHPQRGKFRPERAKALKVRPGPLFAELAAGRAVLNAAGETVTSEQVLEPGKEGGGLAVVDLPTMEYVQGLVDRAEWHDEGVMAGVEAVFWTLGPGVLGDERLAAFMSGLAQKGFRQVVSSVDCCPDRLSLESVAAATIRLRQVDKRRYDVPHHDNGTAPHARNGSQETDGRGVQGAATLPDGVVVAERGMHIDLEPAVAIDRKEVRPFLDIETVRSQTSPIVLEAAKDAHRAIRENKEALDKWANSLPHLIQNATGANTTAISSKDAEIITLGTGSALPSKYRNVSATLLRVPGWGSVLFDCGENTLGQLKRVFGHEWRDVLGELRFIWISHMHADHHLGTASVVKAWYAVVHSSVPGPRVIATDETGEDAFRRLLAPEQRRLAVVGEPAMLHWLHEYAQ
ncbi:hypothetical protein LTR66_006405, partial [Elasticomyces elasticus]